MSSVYFPVQVVVILRRLTRPAKELGGNSATAADDIVPEMAPFPQHGKIRLPKGSGVEPAGYPESQHDDPAPELHVPRRTLPKDLIHQLLENPALYSPLRKPRFPIVLCHGLYGFDTRLRGFPGLRMEYWANVLNILRDKVRAEVIVTSVPGTGSITSRAETLDQQLQDKARGREINFLAHSMGGLDCRHLITHVKPTEYTPLSLTTISTPHRGSPFMDWCAENIGLGKLKKEGQQVASKISQPASSASTKKKLDSSAALSTLSSLPSSFTTLLLSILDSPAYANLTSNYLNQVFNPATPDDPRVKYFSVAARLHEKVNIWHPFWLPKLVLDGAEDKERKRLKEVWMNENRYRWDKEPPLWAREEEWGNDGLVTVQSAKWGEFLGIMEGCDHWEMRGARGIEFGVDLPGIPALGNVNDEGWAWLVKSWKKENKTTSSSVVDRTLQRERQRERDDEAVKSSTDKVSAVFDWIAEQVPAPPLLGSKSKAADSVQGEVDRPPDNRKPVKEEKKNELETKLDLERFYVALSRKLYDVGF